jgi:hypothetical protein
MTSRLRLLAAATFCLVPAAWAGQSDTDPCVGSTPASCQARGVVEKPHLDLSRKALSTAEGQQVGARVTKMLEVALKAPRLREPRGMSLHPSILVMDPPPHAAKHHPARVDASVLALPITVEDKRSVQDKKTGAWKGIGEGPELKLSFNDLGVFLSQTPLDFAKTEQFFSEPLKVGEVQGFPVYDSGSTEVVLIRKGDALPWRSLPVERYLQFHIAQEEKTLAVFQKQLSALQGAARAQVEKVNAERQARIDTWKKELAGLSPAQRQAGTCQRTQRKRGDLTGLELSCGPGTIRLVEANQELFNGTGSKGSLRLLAISTTWGVLPKEDRIPGVLGRILRASVQDMDLKTLQAMLD